MQNLEKPVGYCRVSSKEQAENSRALDNQVARVRSVIGPEAVIYTDICRGEKSTRPQFDKMRAAIQTGLYKEVVVTRIDRLGRNQRTGFQQIVDWWVGKDGPKVKTVCLDTPVDLDRLGGRFNLALMSEAAIFEVDMLSSRVRAGFERAMQSPDRSAKPPFGYICVEGKMVPDTVKRHCPLSMKPGAKGEVYEGVSNAELFQLVMDNYCRTGKVSDVLALAQGYELTRGSEGLGKRLEQFYDSAAQTWFYTKPCFPPTGKSLLRWRFQPEYRGHRGYRRNWDPSLRPANGEAINKNLVLGSDDTYEYFYRDVHEPLITKEQYQQILVYEERQRITVGNAKNNAKGSRGSYRVLPSFARHPLSGLLRCSDCGHTLRLNANRSSGSGGGERWYYRCVNNRCSQHRCGVEQNRVTMAIGQFLQAKAAAIQEGREELPVHTRDDDAQITHLRNVLNHLNACPDRRIVATQVQEVERQLASLQGSPDTEDFLSGTARSLLLSPAAADWGYWVRYLADMEKVRTRLPLLIRSVVVSWINPKGTRAERQEFRLVDVELR
jgi:DNA invertase Pin-like site-specific DNA recombinase